MSRPKSKIPARLIRSETKSIVVYAEGNNEYHYLRKCVSFKFDKGTELPSTHVSAILQKIEQDMNNDAIEQIYWIVDGGDQHNNQSKEFKKFYFHWNENKDKKEKIPYWSKLKILINHPCLEYWFLLHKCDPPCGQYGEFTFFAYGNHKGESLSPCRSLQESDCYTQSFPNRRKGTDDKEFINEIAKNKTARTQAIQRAKCLEDKKPTSITQKTVLSYPCAQIYQLFDGK